MNARPKLLIVDDDPTNTSILRILLRKEYELATAENGQQCLDQVGRFHPQLVLLDVMMPGMNGYEACRRIKGDLGREAPAILMLTASDSPEDRRKGLLAGADDFIVKPFDHDDLCERVRRRLLPSADEVQAGDRKPGRNVREMQHARASHPATFCRPPSLAETAERDAAPVEASRRGGAGRTERETPRGRVLLVDDNQMNVDILHKILRKEYDVATANSGERGLELCREFRPQLVLLDIMMPGLNGYEVCRRIKSEAGDQFVQVILVSGKGSTEERLQGYQAQADDYLVKPFDHGELLSKVRVQFRLWEAQRGLREAKQKLEQHAGNLERLVAERTRELDAHVAALESANEALQELNAKAEAATRAKSEFLTNMSHEIRTPMTSILGFTEVLLGEEASENASSERVQALETIHRNGQYLLRLINDILDLSRIEAGKLDVERTVCSPAKVLAHVASLM
jgi:DNA-binding response OmpR family regulator